MRSFARRLARLLLDVFFRRIEIVGAERVPRGTPLLFALNHPNGLVDPLFLVAFAPAPVSFMAKEPLFRTPLVRHFVRALDCLPVYRAEDGADPRDNARTLEAACALLARGASIALFPEGTTHAGPQLRALKSGAGRIALAARAAMARTGGVPPLLVPVGLHYTARSTFRSRAAVIFGTPLEVPVVAPDGRGEPPRDAVRALTTRLDAALRALTVNASDPELVTLAATAAHLLDDALPAASGDTPPLARRVALMQGILARHDQVRDEDPQRLAALVDRLRTYQQLLAGSGLGDAAPAALDPRRAALHVARTATGLLVLLPLIVAGLIENWPPYRLVGPLARLVARGEEQVLSTLALLLGLTLFPLTWLAISLAAGLAWGWAAGIAHLLLAPLAARAALWFRDRAADTAAGARLLWLAWRRRDDHARIAAARDALIAELLALAEPLPGRG